MNESGAEATIYTGDTVQGVPVIRHLHVADLAPGKHRFFFAGVQMGTGQHWYVPLVVVKGQRPGKRLALVAGVHGDELSSMDAVRQIVAALDPAVMAGTAIALYGVSRPAIEYTRSHWAIAQGGGQWVDFNRVWPGDAAGADAATRHASLVWNHLLMGNVDVAIDYHTITTGSEFTLFLYANLQQPEIRQMAELFPVEQIKDDPGEKGTLELALIDAGIPALTVEIGRPRSFDAAKIALTVEGSLNVFKHYGVMPGALGRTTKDVGTFIGNTFETIRATHGGFLTTQVDVRSTVTPGQTVAVQRNAFGDVVATYTAGVTGQVAAIARDALCEPGARVMQILYDNRDGQ